MDSTTFALFDDANPDVWEAWVIIAKEHRLDPGRTLLSASEVIEALRKKGFTLANDYKPWYARKFNAEFNDGDVMFKCHRLRNGMR